MKLFKQFSAMMIAVSAAAALSLNVSAGVVGFDYAPAGGNIANYEFTADDGTEGWLYFTIDDDGNIWFSSYDIGLLIPQDPNDVHNRMNFDGDYQEFTSSQDFFDYVDELEKENGESKYIRYAGLVAEFDRKFDPPSDGIISMSGGRCYVADFENDTVSYAGYYVVYEEAAAEYPESDTVYRKCTAEDGSRFILYFDSLENGRVKYTGWEAEIAPNGGYAYSTDENSEVIFSSITPGIIDELESGQKLYSDPDMIPLAENEVLAEGEAEEYVEDVSGAVIASIKTKKYFVITVDGMDSTVRYAGCSYEIVRTAPEFEQPDPASDFSDGATASPNTGNGGGYLNIMLAAAGLAVLAKRAKK
ncbi:MAG: hypothetical protein HDT24_08840 [Ruminococcus sp.]|nr:hypothetical protein [Ruminococcus sp.]